MSIKPRFGFIVEYVKDIDAAKRFYTDVLGIEVERAAPNFVQFHDFAIASDEPLSPKGDPELYWLVDDAEAAYAELSKKAEVVSAPTQMPFGTVFSIKDPDGRPRYLLQFARERPSTPA